MNRGGTTSRRMYITPSIPSGDTYACRVIQAQKNILLTSLAGYFAKEIDKNALKHSLHEIKSTLSTQCPSYVPTGPCC